MRKSFWHIFTPTKLVFREATRTDCKKIASLPHGDMNYDDHHYGGVLTDGPKTNRHYYSPVIFALDSDEKRTLSENDNENCPNHASSRNYPRTALIIVWWARLAYGSKLLFFGTIKFLFIKVRSSLHFINLFRSLMYHIFRMSCRNRF